MILSVLFIVVTAKNVTIELGVYFGKPDESCSMLLDNKMNLGGG